MKYLLPTVRSEEHHPSGYGTIKIGVHMSIEANFHYRTYGVLDLKMERYTPASSAFFSKGDGIKCTSVHIQEIAP